MPIYITGIEGMLGRALHRYYSDGGQFAAGCDIRRPTMPSSAQIDIRDRLSLFQHMQSQRPDIVFHCAAMLGVGNTENHPAVCNDININGTINAFHAAVRAGARRFVYLSSSEVYGLPVGTNPLSEKSPIRGNNVYAKGKHTGERILLDMAKDAATEVVICRMFNCYGPYQVKQFFIPKAISAAKQAFPIRIFGNEKNVRSYLHADDAARHIVEVMLKAPANEVVNIASTQRITLGDAAKVINCLCQNPSQIELFHGRDGWYDDRRIDRDIPNRLADITKLRQYSRYVEDNMTFTEGVRDVIKQYDTLSDDWEYKRSMYYA